MAALVSSVIRELVLIRLRSCNSVVINSRRFIRGLRRRPVAVLYPGDERETFIKPTDQIKQRKHDTETQKRHPDRTDGRRRRGESPESGHTEVGVGVEVGRWSGNVSRVSVKSCGVREQLGGLRFDKALPGDKRLATLVSIARSRAFREKEGKVLLEGKRLICDAVAAGASPQVLFFSRVERLRELPLDRLGQASLVKVKFEDIKIWSDLVAPQGVIAIFSKPDKSQLVFPKDVRLQSVPLYLICDNVRDPGSLGTILRCAAAAGCDSVLLTQGCVDPWEPKVLRAAMGAHFRLPIFSGLNWDSISEHLPEPVTVHIADDASRNIKFSDTQVSTPGKICKHADLEEYIESDSDKSDDDEEPFIPCLEEKLYHETWAQKNTALVINGETQGLSAEALQLAEETHGYKLFVPLTPGVACLNSAMMASILLFEGRKQLLKLAQKPRRAKSIIQ